MRKYDRNQRRSPETMENLKIRILGGEFATILEYLSRFFVAIGSDRFQDSGFSDGLRSKSKERVDLEREGLNGAVFYMNGRPGILKGVLFVVSGRRRKREREGGRILLALFRI